MISNPETKALLAERWERLPEGLKLDNQMVGQYWAQCGFTLGPSYCSFGCSHCYLPGNANRVPMPSLDEMKAQVDANRAAIGEGGNIQLTGGDLIDAYVRAGKKDELIELVSYCVKSGLVPMIMTHGQSLMDDPDYLCELMVRGGLRKISCHIDITQAGRAGFPVKTLSNEAQLNAVRNRLVDLVLDVRRRTGLPLNAAQTVTVTSRNIESISEIIRWLVSRPCNMDVTRTLSFQSEAAVGRTRMDGQAVTPERVWQQISAATGRDLPRNGLLYGHPDCTSTAVLLVGDGGEEIASLITAGECSAVFWSRLLETLSGLNIKTNSPVRNTLVRTVAVMRRPSLIVAAFRFLWEQLRGREVSPGLLFAAAIGRARGVNLVLHNFIHQADLIGVRDEKTCARLSACSFRGAVRDSDGWRMLPMCEVNALQRPQIYSRKIREARATV